MSRTIHYTLSFNAQLKELLKKFPRSEKTIRGHIERLAEDPDQGDVYPGFGSALRVRKVRIPLTEYKMSRSKGLRLIHMEVKERSIVAPLVIYKKGNPAAEHEIKRLILSSLKQILQELS